MIEDMRIPAAEVEFCSLSLFDAGRVFRWRGKLYRAIRMEFSETMRDLFSSGLVDALVKEGMLVPSRIADYEMDGYGLLVEHEIVEVVSYPREWSYSMLKEAALLILRINEISGRFGYQTKDCHGYNVLFVGERPLYVDLGSFVPFSRENHSLLALDEFLRSYYFPLRIWASLGTAWGMKAVPRAGGIILEPADYLRGRWAILRLSLLDSVVQQVLSKLHKLYSATDQDLDDLRRQRPAWQASVAAICRKLGKSSVGIESLKRRLLRVNRRQSKTMWSHYHDTFSQESGEIKLSPRFRYVANLLLSLDISSVLEIAGNQGVLSRSFKRANPDLRAICTDADEAAVDKGYCASKVEGLGINWAVLDPFFTEGASIEDSPTARFKADAVVVLALTHHLILSRSLPLGWILDVLSQYSRRFMLVEFMPLGLYVGPGSPPVPSWYTAEWFEQHFKARFDLKERTQLEDNRILFVGTKRLVHERKDDIGNATP